MIELIGYRVYKHKLNDLGKIADEAYVEGKKKSKVYPRKVFLSLIGRYRKMKSKTGLAIDFHFKELK